MVGVTPLILFTLATFALVDSKIPFRSRLPMKPPDGIDCQDLTGFLSYGGSISLTADGLTCQQWSSQYPHPHSNNVDSLFPADVSVKAAMNYCRDPDGSGRPWCYTTNTNVRWQYCRIPACNRDCWYGSNSRHYYGNHAHTASGRPCQRWDSQLPHEHINNSSEKFPLDDSVSAANNYCRDPDMSGRPWCYTTYLDRRWEYCSLPCSYPE